MHIFSKGLTVMTVLGCSLALPSAADTCHHATEEQLQVLSDAGDYRASFLLGAKLLAPNSDEYAVEKAQAYFAKGAAKNHPQSMYFFAFVSSNYRDTRGMIIGAAERGFVRAYGDLVHWYANKENDLYSKVDAYAWITLCEGRDPLCHGNDVDQLIASLTDREKALGEKLKVQILEKQRNNPKYNEVSNCLNEWQPLPDIK